MRSLARTWATARLDLGHNLRRPLFWIWLLLIALVAWGFSSGSMRVQSGDSTVGGTKAFITSEFAVAQVMSVLVLLVHGFFVAIGAGMTILRDEELNVGAVLHGTPLGPKEYVWGKFMAALASFVVLLAAHAGLMVFFNHVTTGAEEAEFIGPLVAANYVRPTILLGLPVVLFLAGFCFWVGERFRRPIVVFVLPLALLLSCVFFLWTWSPSWLGSGWNRLLMLVDPSGHRWMRETWLDVDRGVEFYNTAAIPYDVTFLASRVVYALLGLVAVVLAARHFAATLRGSQARAVAVAGDAPATGAATGSVAGPARPPLLPRPLAALGMRTRRPGILGGILTVTRVELRELLSSPGMYLFLPLIVMEVVANSLFVTGPFDTTPLITSGTLSVRAVTWLTSFVCLLLLFYTVESLRREEATGFASLSYATPLRTFSLLFAKALANALVGVVALGVTLAASFVVILVQGSVPFDVEPFLLVWGLILLPTFLVWSTFVAFVYSLVRSRYTTYGVALAVLWLSGYTYWKGDQSWTWNWALWGTLQWSDMGRFELVRDELVLNRALALFASLAFTVLTVRLFPRRSLDATSTLLRLRPLPLAKSALKLSPVLVPPIVLAILLSNRIEAGFQGDAAEKAAKDYWRKNVATWTDARTPDIVGVDLELDLFPERQSFEVRGTYTLENRDDDAFAVIPVTRGASWRRPDSLPPEEGAEGPIWRLDGAPFEPEDSAGLMLFRLPEPLEPGQSIDLGFHHCGEVPSGATQNGGGTMEFILPSGVVLTSFGPSFVPVLGYDESRGVDEDNAYDSKEYPDGFHEGVTRSIFGTGSAPFPVRMRISAPTEYTINAPGVLASDEVVEGRRVVVWETDAPVRFFNVVAGRWTVARGEEGTAIYHHPEHTYNVEAMVEALDGCRRYYSEWFYEYPWKELKLSEFPALAGYAQGFPTNITFSEGIGFLTKGDADAADGPFMVTAHEAAHQWWGNILVPGEGPGGNLLSEGTAHFSTMLLFGEMRGPRGRIAFARQIEDQYAERRHADSERPLVKIDGSRPGDSTVTYDKAGWVFWMLLNHMGRESCLAGIESFIAHYVDDRDHPVLQDFVAHLRPFAPDAEAYDAFVAQWFFDVVVPEYRLADVERVEEAGSWKVTATVTNVGTGTMSVEVAASAGERFSDVDEDGSSPEDGDVVLAREVGAGYRDAGAAVVLGPGESAPVEITCDFDPERVVVDPDALVLMLRRKQAVFEF